MAVGRMSRSSVITPGRSNEMSGPGLNKAMVQALVVAGGGSPSTNGSYPGGSGGAGGLIDQVLALDLGTYTVTVGAGGAGVPTNYTQGNPGNPSVFGPLTANGGGYGGTGGNPGSIGGPGASGGGSGYAQGGKRDPDGTGQGFAGGATVGTQYIGGGGGAGQAGNAFDGSYFRRGGLGRSSSIISTTVATAESVGEVGAWGSGNPNKVWFSGGGAGGPNTPYAAAGGLGGGALYNTSAVANTGGGAGSAALYTYNIAGGSGVVIIRLSSEVRVTVSAGLTYATDTSVTDSVAYIFKSGTGTVTFY